MVSIKSCVDLIVLGDALEGLAIRAVLEGLNILVRTHFIGNAQELVTLFHDGKPLSPTVILSCHGDESGIILPELAPEIEKDMPYQRRLSAKNIAEFSHFNNQIIINTGCTLGSSDFGYAFINSGASAYLASPDYVEGSAALMFTVNILYHYMTLGRSIKDAFERIQNSEPSLVNFTLFQ